MKDDAISRVAAIEAIEFGITHARAINKETGEVKELFQEGNDELKKAVERVNALPPAQPNTARRIVGKSRGGMTLWYQCDMCNEPVNVQDNYCRVCGRRLIDERSD